MSKRLLGYLALIAGAIGLAACVVVLFVEWRAASRAHQVTDRLFAAVDHTLDGTQEKVVQVQQRVAAMTITASDVADGLKDRTTDEIRERLTSELKLAERSEQLSAGIEQADEWAGVAESSVESAHSLVELLTVAGIEVDTAGLDGVLEEITALRSQLTETGEQVATFRAHLETDDEEHAGQIVTIVARVAATLTSLDERIGKFSDRLSVAQESIATAERTSQRWITTASITLMLLLVWLAAGQAALVYVGWKNVRAG